MIYYTYIYSYICDIFDCWPHDEQLQGYVIKCPHLKKLSITSLCVKTDPQFFDLLLRPLPGIYNIWIHMWTNLCYYSYVLSNTLSELTHLDLSGAFHMKDMNFSWLAFLPKLLSLILHNVRGRLLGWSLNLKWCYHGRCWGLSAVRVSTEAVTSPRPVSVPQVQGKVYESDRVPRVSCQVSPLPPVSGYFWY